MKYTRLHRCYQFCVLCICSSVALWPQRRFNEHKSSNYCYPDNRRNYIFYRYMSKFGTISFTLKFHWFYRSIVTVKSINFVACNKRETKCVYAVHWAQRDEKKNDAPKSRQYSKWLLCEYCVSLSAILPTSDKKGSNNGKRLYIQWNTMSCDIAIYKHL